MFSHRRRRVPGNRELWRADRIGGIMPVMDSDPGGESGRCYVSALSQHPDWAQAAAEVTAAVLEQLGAVPELAVFFVTPPHRDAIGDIADVVRSVLQPVTLLGAAAVAVLGPRSALSNPGGGCSRFRCGSKRMGGVQGTSDPNRELLDAAALVGHLVPAGSVYAFLAEHRRRLFPDDLFADLFRSGRGRPSVPADVVATVMVLQSLHGLSDREAAEAVTFDLRGEAAAGLPLEAGAFHPTNLTHWRGPVGRPGRPNPDFG